MDYLITFATKPYGTHSYRMTGCESKADAIREATAFARVELGSVGYRLKEARVYADKNYVCKG